MAKEGLTLDDLWPNRASRLYRLKHAHYALNLKDKTHAYFYGLALADGTIRVNERNSGAVSIELKSSDDAPLRFLKRWLPWKFRISRRLRSSPFNGSRVEFTSLVCHAYDLRNQLVGAGFPIGAKSRTCCPPPEPYDHHAFWRGYLDGDGSLGVDGRGIPFLSLVTASKAISEAYLEFVEPVIGFTPRISANKRDGVWNIMLQREHAQHVLRVVYRPFELLCIPRKAESAVMAGDWQRDAPWRRKKKARVQMAEELK